MDTILPKIEFRADKVVLYPILTDKSFKVVLYVGEYEKQIMKEIVGLPEGVWKIQISPDIQKDANRNS